MSAALTLPSETSETKRKITIEVKNNDNILYETTDEDIRANIWGPFYWIVLGTGQLFPYNPSSNKFKNIIRWVPSFISVILLAARCIYMFYKMGKSTALSLDWSYDTILFFLALHSAVSALALIVFNKANYIQKSIEKIRHSSRNIIIKRKVIHLIFNLNIFVIFLLPAAIYIAGNFEILDQDLKDLENHNPPIPINETIKIRKKIAVGRIISIIDAIINLWGSYISASALTVYLLANRAICRQYHAFNKILKSHIVDGSIMNYEIIKEHESQIIDFMSSACYITNTTAFLINLTFMTGILAQISAQFALRAFSLSAIENVIFGIWTAQSIVLLVVSTKRPAILQSLLNETTEMIWLDQGIWKTCDDVLIRETARNISDRIGSVDYASKGLTPTRASNLVFNAVLLIIPFFIDIVAANKYLPNVIKKSA